MLGFILRMELSLGSGLSLGLGSDLGTVTGAK